MTPAAFTHVSTPPWARTALAASRSTASGSATSVGTAVTLAPMRSHSAAALSNDGGSRAASVSEAPRRANSMAAQRPMPLEAPVITTEEPSTGRGMAPSGGGRVLRRLVCELEEVRDRLGAVDEGDQPRQLGHPDHADAEPGRDPLSHAVRADEQLSRRHPQAAAARLLAHLAVAVRLLVAYERRPQGARHLVLRDQAAELVGRGPDRHEVPEPVSLRQLAPASLRRGQRRDEAHAEDGRQDGVAGERPVLLGVALDRGLRRRSGLLGGARHQIAAPAATGVAIVSAPRTGARTVPRTIGRSGRRESGRR